MPARIVEQAMDTDRNLLFAVLALQADVLDADRFVQICTLWTTRKQSALADLLIELAWITPAERADVERLMERKLRKHGATRGLGWPPPVMTSSVRSLRCRTKTFNDHCAICHCRTPPPRS